LFDNLDGMFVRKSFNEIQVLTLKLLRFLYSVEKNRPYIRKILPSELFSKFVDIGDYTEDFKLYQNCLKILHTYLESDLKTIINNIEKVNMTTMTHFSETITNPTNNDTYKVKDNLGKGAFGQVKLVELDGSQ